VSVLDDRPTATSTNPLPTARGPVSESVIEYVTGRSARLWTHRGDASRDDGDAQLALWLLNVVDVSPDGGVDPDRARSLAVRGLHWSLERSFEDELQRRLPAVDPDVALQTHLDELLAAPAIDATARAIDVGADAVRDVFTAKAPYLGFEADPHTLALARLEAPLKPVVAAIQAGEYGIGHEQTHAQIYRSCLTRLSLGYADAVDTAPPAALAFANLAWLFGRDVRWRGAAVGQLCLLELDSVQPCRAAVDAWDATSLPTAARRWYDVHVLADAEHEVVVRERLVPAIETETPWLAADAAFGATATWVLQQQVARQLLGRWTSA
jgi:hypothetical protein